MSSLFGKQIGNAPAGVTVASFVDFVDDLDAGTPLPTGELAYVAQPTSRVVKVTASGQGTNGSVFTVTNGATIVTGTVGVGSTSATVISGGNDAESFASNITTWIQINAAAIGDPSATVDTADVTTTYPGGTSYNTQVWACDDPAVSIAEFKENGDPCDVLVAGIGAGVYTWREGTIYNLDGFGTSEDSSSLVNSGSAWPIYNAGGDIINTSLDNSSFPYQAQWTGSTVTAIPAGTDATAYKATVEQIQITGLQTAVLQADFPKTNDTLEAGKTYRVTLLGAVGAEPGGAVFDFGGGTVTATGMSGIGMVMNVGSNTIAPTYIFSLTTPVYGFDADGSNDGFTAEVTIHVNAGGTLIPRFAQSTTDVTASNLKKYATISAQEMSPNPVYA